MDTLTLLLAVVISLGVICFFLTKKWLIANQSLHQKRMALISDCINQHKQQIKIRQRYLDNYNFTKYNLGEVLVSQHPIGCS